VAVIRNLRNLRNLSVTTRNIPSPSARSEAKIPLYCPFSPRFIQNTLPRTQPKSRSSRSNRAPFGFTPKLAKKASNDPSHPASTSSQRRFARCRICAQAPYSTDRDIPCRTRYVLGTAANSPFAFSRW
jgi:hypothetical protein